MSNVNLVNPTTLLEGLISKIYSARDSRDTFREYEYTEGERDGLTIAANITQKFKLQVEQPLTLLETASLVQDLVDSTKEDLKAFFQDVELDHEERWEHYLAWSRLGGDQEYYCYHGLDGISNKYFGDEDLFCYNGIYNVERYTTVDLTNIADTLAEIFYIKLCNKKLIEDTFEKYIDEPTVKQMVYEVKEQLMKDAVSSFTYDW